MRSRFQQPCVKNVSGGNFGLNNTVAIEYELRQLRAQQLFHYIALLNSEAMVWIFHQTPHALFRLMEWMDE
jgi:hypothetical protein